VAATMPVAWAKGRLWRVGAPVVGIWLALTVALVASADSAQAAATTRNQPFTVDTSLKSASGFSATELDAFVKKYEASSPLAKYGTYFIQAEQKSNVNAQGLLAIAINQTSWGTAGAAKDNNFFAIKGKKYPSASAGILDGAAWIDKNYLTKGGPYYVSPTLKGMGVHYSTKSSWAGQVAAIADRMGGAKAGATPRPPSAAPKPGQPQPQPSCVPAMQPAQGSQGQASVALPCDPTSSGGGSDASGDSGGGPNDSAAQGGVSLPPDGAEPSPGAGQASATGQNGQGAAAGQPTPAPSQQQAPATVTMAGNVQHVAQAGMQLWPLVLGLVLLIAGVVVVVIARRRPTF
jgi:hypothetical protein